MARQAHQVAGSSTAGRTGGGGPVARPRDGIITGYLLKLLRQSAGLSQEALAEQVGVDSNTIQGWESGRRSLTGTRVATLVQLQHRLRQHGADPKLLALVEDAAEADYVLSYALTAEPTAIRPATHLLTNWVLKRSFAYMLAWPFTGRPPVALNTPIARRGPSPDAPVLTAAEKARFFEHLRVTAERSLTDREVDEASGTLLRRNIYYPLSWHRSGDTAAWLEEMKQREERRLGRLDSWSPRWVAARSLAVARARHGDKEPLRHFIRTALSSDACQAAGLNYDAYWIGATPETYRSDEFMARDLAPWVGVTLLRRFAANLVATEPLADLYVHSTWALLQRRGSVLEGDPKLAAELLARTEALASEGDLSAQSRRELEQVHYGVRLFQSRP
jgi:transcriptional regulator with XRE-family HTH domain